MRTNLGEPSLGGRDDSLRLNALMEGALGVEGGRDSMVKTEILDKSALALFNCLPWPAIVVDHVGRVRHLNSAMSSSSGIQDAEDDSSLEQLFPEYYQRLREEELWLTPRTINVSYPVGEGAMVHEQVLLREIPGGVCLIVIDQTKLRQLEEGNAQTTRLASLGFMLASATHEMCNPLSAVSSMVQILQSKRGVSGSVLQKGLKNIQMGINQILGIARKLSVFSRIDDDRRLEAPVDAAIAEAMLLLSYDSLGESIHVIHESDPVALVFARQGQLEQVFLNVLLNAAQAMKGQGTITITTRRIVPFTVIVSIRDDGPGVAPENIKKIFEPFFSTKCGDGGGTGLGLAISNEIIIEHRGSIAVENHPDGGACFHILLPLATGKLGAPQ